MADAKSKAEEAKDKAQAALEKANDTKNKVERSNDDLRDLIKQIRDFLTREFSPIMPCIYMCWQKTNNIKIINKNNNIKWPTFFCPSTTQINLNSVHI